MDMGILFASQPLEVSSTPASASGSTTGSSANANAAIPFGQALKVLSQKDGNKAGTEAVNGAGKASEKQDAAASEQLVLLMQTALPFAEVNPEQSEGKMITQVDKKMLEDASESLKLLLDKATQLQQQMAATPKQVKDEQPQVIPPAQSISANEAEQEVTTQAVIKETFGDKLVQEKIPQLVANNDLQQKVAASQVQTTAEQTEQPELTVLVAKEATDKVAEKLTDGKQAANQDPKLAQIITQASESKVLPKQSAELGQQEENRSQTKPQISLTELALDNKKPETGLEKEFSTINASLTNSQSKEVAPQKIMFTDQPVKFDDVKEIVDKLVEQARLTQKPGISEMVIKLKPQHLGEMTIRIVAGAGGAVSAAFHSNNAEVRGLLQESLPVIRQELSNTGLKVHDVGVYAGLSDFQSFAGHEQRSLYDQQVNGGSINKLTKEDQELLDELQLAKNGENLSADGGVDYRV